MKKRKNKIMKIVAISVSFILLITMNVLPLVDELNFFNVLRKFASVYADEPPVEEEYIYFDINAGNVSISNGQYSGYVFVKGVAKPVSGTHSAGNRYYIYQSTGSNKASTGYALTADYEADLAVGFATMKSCRVPEYEPITYNDQAWGDYITGNNSDSPLKIKQNWETAATAVGRSMLNKKSITIADNGLENVSVIIDNIWLMYGNESGDNSSVASRNADIITYNSFIDLRLKGDNRCTSIYALVDPKNTTYKQTSGTVTGLTQKQTLETLDWAKKKGVLRITSAEGNGKESGTLTLASQTEKGMLGANRSLIGSNDRWSYDGSNGQITGWLILELNGGTVYAGTSKLNNSTIPKDSPGNYIFHCIGSRFRSNVTINGGRITAVSNGTAAAIGGGGGFNSEAGVGVVAINGGKTYAYSNAVYSVSHATVIPGNAIGSGSCGNNKASFSIVDISGGEVYAQSIGSVAIGAGSSVSQGGGNAEVTISGGKIEAHSIGDTVNGVPVTPKIAIGGGVGKKNGGTATIKISGEAKIISGSVGGGSTIDEDGKTGHATIDISGNPDIQSQFVMAGGGLEQCTFKMSGGVIHNVNAVTGSYLHPLGGALWMDDENGKAQITGGTIRDCTARLGGAVYMAGGSFTMDDSGSIINCTATERGGGIYIGNGTFTIKNGTIAHNTAMLNGGGVDIHEGTFVMEGGTVEWNTAMQDGGGIYMAGGAFEMTGGVISHCEATGSGGGVFINDVLGEGAKFSLLGGDISHCSALSGGAVYICDGEVIIGDGDIEYNSAEEDGGGIYISDGTFTMYSGDIEYNTAGKDGGGIFIKSELKAALVDILSGSISYNKATADGGGIAIKSQSDKEINIIVGVCVEHPNLKSDRSFDPFAYPYDCGEMHIGHNHDSWDGIHKSCPVVVANESGSKGGGLYISTTSESGSTHIYFYCIVERENKSATPHCDSMYLEGGVEQIIGDRGYDGHGNAKGNIRIETALLVEGGSIDVYGEMTNPQFTKNVTVDIANPERDHYIDHRQYNVDALHYKVHYYENFKEEGSEIPTGKYIAKQYPDFDNENLTVEEGRYYMTIMASIFAHPGYKIVGWCTNPTPESLDPDNPSDGDFWYQVNVTYDLSELDEGKGMGATIVAGNPDPFLLTIYAIWERCGYVLQYEPNVPQGHSYSGSMENQQVTVGIVDGTQTLLPNGFNRTGYLFLGWTLSPDGMGTTYQNECPIEADFSEEDGAIIPLFAKWVLCTHIGHLRYAEEGATLAESCSACGAHHATATISAVNAVYDGEEHLATVFYSTQWLGGELFISYRLGPSEWDTKDTVFTSWVTGTSVPVHAGDYTASVSVGFGSPLTTATANTEFTISQVKAATPAVPQIHFFIENSQNIIELSAPIGDGIQYQVAQENNEIHDGGWQSENRFPNLTLNYYYYFYARKTGDRDHTDSEISISSAYLAMGGNVVTVNNDLGIKVTLTASGSLIYTVAADTGYHFYHYSDNADTAVANAHPVEGSGSSAFLNDGGITLVKETVGGEYQYTITFIEGEVAFHQLTLELHGVAKDVTVEAKATNGQTFIDFNNTPVSISRDSAFTAQFTVNDLIPVEYETRKITFDQSLPIGTTIIFQTNGYYWYYVLDAECDSVDLSSFTKMGGSANYAYDKTGITAEDPTTYRFVIDFSQASSYPAVGTLNVTLGLLSKGDCQAPSVSLPGAVHASCEIKPSAQFAMTSSVTGKDAVLDLTYLKSLGAASVWEGRNTSLVLVPTSIDIPSDVKVTAVVDGLTTTYIQGNNGVFIIPLSSLQGHSVKLSVHSATFDSIAQSITFNAKWYVSDSASAFAPLSGDCMATEELTFSCVADPIPSLRVDGAYRVRKAGETLTLTVSYLNIPVSGVIKANVQNKNGSTYVDTGDRKIVTQNMEGHTDVNFNIGTMSAGSYCILVTVTQDGGRIMQVPYYFAVIE